MLQALSDLGGMALLGARIVVLTVRPPYRPSNLLAAMDVIGAGSLSVVVLTAFFAGAVFAMQISAAFRLFDAQALVGSSVALTLTRELAPVLTGLMVTGRAGAAIATELGSMRVTEQIDALATMAVDPEQYLIVPRVLAGLLAFPLLTAIFNLVGLGAAYLIAVHLEGVTDAEFWSRIPDWIGIRDVLGGIAKAAIFGWVVMLAACYKGFYAQGGARGVGVATTQAVVLGSVLILVLDYLLTSWMLPWWRAG